jgi:hypothetical protein
MAASVVVRSLRLNRHQPRCASGLKCDASWADCCAGTLRRIKPINVPEQRPFEAVGQQFVLNDAATKLTSPLGRVLDAGRRSCAAAIFAVSSESSIPPIAQHASCVFIGSLAVQFTKRFTLKVLSIVGSTCPGRYAPAEWFVPIKVISLNKEYKASESAPDLVGKPDIGPLSRWIPLRRLRRLSGIEKTMWN